MLPLMCMVRPRVGDWERIIKISHGVRFKDQKIAILLLHPVSTVFTVFVA